MKFLVLFSVLATALSMSLQPVSYDKRHTFSAASLLSEAGGKEKILEMIEKLRSDNRNTIEIFTNKKTAAIADEAAKKKTLTAAEHAEEIALGLVEDKKAEISTLQEDVDGKRVIEQNAEAKLDTATANAAAAAKFLEEEEARIDDERELLEDVHKLLDQLAASAALLETDFDGPAGRRLLSIVDLSSLAEADPAAITEVRQMITDLITAGEADRVSAQDADKAAKLAHKKAKDAHTKAWEILALAIGRVDFATIELGKLVIAAEKATHVRETAEAAHEVSVAALTVATEELTIEEIRVKKEEAIFVQVSKLLATLQ